MKVYVVHYTSESSDHYLYAFDHKPTKKQIANLVKNFEFYPDEDESEAKQFKEFTENMCIKIEEIEVITKKKK